jgi:hypothetical protein
VPATDSLFGILAQEEKKWPMRMDEDETKMKILLPPVERLISQLADN